MISIAGQRFYYFWQRYKHNFLQKKIAVLGSQNPLNYSCLNFGKNINFVSNQKDSLKAAKYLGFIVGTAITENFDLIIFELTKNAHHNLSIFAQAEEKLNIKGTLILNGDNELGIHSFIKKINYYWRHTDLIIKRKGRIAVFVKERKLVKTINHWKHLSEIKINKDGFYTGVEMFSWKKIDKGSKRLSVVFKDKLYGNVADLGSGWGYLSKEALLLNERISKITLFENNFSAINASKLNLIDKRAQFKWLDIESLKKFNTQYDHVICNPPFHTGRKKSIEILELFINCSASIIKKNGTVWMVFVSDISIDKYLVNKFENLKIVSKDKHYKVYQMSSVKIERS